MLVDMLKEINDMEAFSKKALANKLNTSESMVEHLLTQLKRMGYIEEEKMPNNFCNKKCAGCNIKCSVNIANSLYITDKGKKLLTSK